jgi:acid phosphatase type 7
LQRQRKARRCEWICPSLNRVPLRTRSEMLVQWTTRDVGEPEVRWGLEPSVHPFSAAAASRSYARGEMCGPPANAAGWVDPGTLHAAVLADLMPDTRYYYVYGDAVCPSRLH